MELVAVITLCEWPVLGTWGWYRQTGVTKQCLHALLNTFQVWYVSVYHISTHLGVLWSTSVGGWAWSNVFWVYTHFSSVCVLLVIE